MQQVVVFEVVRPAFLSMTITSDLAGMVTYLFNPNTEEADVGGVFWVPDQLELTT